MSDIELLNKRRDRLIRHINNVRDNCDLLGHRLIEKGEVELAHCLIANGFIHDNSKFRGIEWEGLHEDVRENNAELFRAAAKQHTTTNPHHPEYWGSIHEMPRIYVAEMVCDWAGRSKEFGDDLREWIREKATKKFEMTVQSKTYKEIKEFVDLLLDEPFK